ncbi:MAG TPA: NnrU family protein [Steroidobacteraceae bacterium]|nr:NnrU family protein [Steroidobacteraceae bacterium]
MLMLIVGLILFFGPHSIAVVAPGWRNRVVMHLRERSWKGAYSLLSAAGLIFIVLGFAHARRSPLVLYTSPAWLHDVTWVLMLPVFPLLLAAYLPGRIQGAAKHPMLAAIKLWATAHLLVNGTLADVLLFGSFLIWAVAVRISVKRRVPASVRGAPPSRYNDLIALLLGLALYALFILRLHAVLIGVPLLGPPG